MHVPSKEALRRELVAQLEAALASAVTAQQAAAAAATHEEARPENDKDTRALEQSYLARGQAARVAKLQRALSEARLLPVRSFAADEVIAVGAIVTLHRPGAQLRRVLVSQGGGGTRVAGGTIEVVSTSSPLGEALLGCRRGDTVEPEGEPGPAANHRAAPVWKVVAVT